jgi:hypothetical protein
MDSEILVSNYIFLLSDILGISLCMVASEIKNYNKSSTFVLESEKQTLEK